VQYVSADDVRWATGPARHEAGTPAVLGAVAVAAACRALEQLGWQVIEAHEAHLLERLRCGLEAIDGISTYTLWRPAGARIGMITFNLAGWNHALLAAVLSAEYGIGVRDGAFCAQPLLRELTGAQAAGGAVRASVGIGTRAADVDRLVEAIAQISRNGAKWSYRARDGYIVPEPDPRPRPALGGLLAAHARLSVLPPTWPESSTGATSSRAPTAWQSCCHGTTFA
jgi:selenocysteine lyase/cysteine desulfurase